MVGGLTPRLTHLSAVSFPEDQEAELYHYYRAPDSRAESPSGLPSDSRRLPLNRRPLMALSHH
jgi:hypothetical protein